eukprot:SAG31_NODE_1214_length_9340_cov_30.386799_5_plen_86_part_00
MATCFLSILTRSLMYKSIRHHVLAPSSSTAMTIPFVTRAGRTRVLFSALKASVSTQTSFSLRRYGKLAANSDRICPSNANEASFL